MAPPGVALVSVAPPDGDLYDLFVSHAPGVHVLRASEPALRLRHREAGDVGACDAVGTGGAAQRCRASRDEGLASGARLATLLLRRARRLDGAHLDAMRIQNAPDGAEQMKPNMLRK